MKRILIMENSLADFNKSRLAYALFLVKRGWEVHALIPKEEFESTIQLNSGVTFIECNLRRRNKGLFHILELIVFYRRIFSKYDYSVAHSFRFQPNLINVIAGLGFSQKKVLHVTGLGVVFSNNLIWFRLLRFLSHLIYLGKFILADKIIFQNEDDLTDLWYSRFFKGKAHVISGSGVDLKRFNKGNYNGVSRQRVMNLPDDVIVFTFISRLIWEKGVGEIVTAFKDISKFNDKVVLCIVGWSDMENPRHVSRHFLKQLENDRVFRFLGHRNDIPELLACSDVFIYPSYYREGVPRSLIEALAMGLPIITTDMPGCRDTISAGSNGILIRPRSTQAIVDGVISILSRDFRVMGDVSRSLAEFKFSDEIIFNAFENIYY